MIINLSIIYLIYIFSFLRYKANDTDILDQCSLCDPRVKTLVHLGTEKRKAVEQRALSAIEVGDVDESGDGNLNDERELQSRNVPPCDNDNNILTSLLGNFATSETGSEGATKAEMEMRKYLAEPTCDMNSNPLHW